MPNKLRRPRKGAVIKGRPRAATFVDRKDVSAAAGATTLTGTLNPVDRMQLKPKLEFGTGDSTVFFKADDPAQPTSQYAVASTRLARFLGMPNLIAHNAFAKLRNVHGVVSGNANGVQLRKAEYDTEKVYPDPGAPESEKDDWAAQSQFVKRDGRYYAMSELIYQWVDLKDPRIQKGMSDLQLFDAISGQVDRHTGNVFVDIATGEVTGIDDDLSFARGTRPDEQDQPRDKYAGLPALVDVTTANRILALNPGDLRTELESRTNDVRELTDEEIRDAQLRLQGVQAHLRTLRQNGALVTAWDDATYQQARVNPRASYVGRYADTLDEALQGSHAGLAARVVNAPPPVPAPLPVPQQQPPANWQARPPRPAQQPGPTVRPGPPVGTRRVAVPVVVPTGNLLPPTLDTVNLPPLPALPPPVALPNQGPPPRPRTPARAALARWNGATTPTGSTESLRSEEELIVLSDDLDGSEIAGFGNDGSGEGGNRSTDD